MNVIHERKSRQPTFNKGVDKYFGTSCILGKPVCDILIDNGDNIG
mgnify:CR=1 FL=1